MKIATMVTKQVALKIVQKIKDIIVLVASEALLFVTQNVEILYELELNSVIMETIKVVKKIVKQIVVINVKVKLEKSQYVFARIRTIRIQKKNLKNLEDGMTEEDIDNKSHLTNQEDTPVTLARKDILKINLTSIDNMTKVLKHQILLMFLKDMLAMYVGLTITMTMANISISQFLKLVEMERSKKVKNVITAIKLDALTAEYKKDITVLKIKI